MNREDEQLPRVPTDRSNDDPGEFGKAPEEETSSSFWAKIKWLKDRGLHKGDYQEYEKPFYNLNKGGHYFVLDNSAKRTIKCISCPVKHGGMLEAHLLTRYALKDGVLSLDGRAINQTPENFHPGV